MSKPRLCVDFDDTIFDGKGLLPGCIDSLSRLRQSYSIAIFSAASNGCRANPDGQAFG